MIADDTFHGKRTAAAELILPKADRLSSASTSLWHSVAGGGQAGGDWCEATTISDGMVALTIGDVSGHGTAVAGTMAAVRASILRTIHTIAVPSEILAVANEVAYSEGDGVIVTAIVAFLNQRLHTLTFANAGHPPPLLLSDADHAFLEHPPADIPLGIFRHHRAADYVIALPRNAMLVLYTDGVTEHDRDPIRGENDLLEAARLAYNWPDIEAAGAIAKRIFRYVRGVDDAATLVLRATS